MLYLFEVTLTQNRTDTVRIWAESLIQVLNFYQTFSTATVTQVKKVVYHDNDEKDYISEKYDHELKTILSSDKRSKIFSLRFVKQNLSKDKIIQVLKQDLLLLKDPIKEVKNIVIFKN